MINAKISNSAADIIRSFTTGGRKSRRRSRKVPTEADSGKRRKTKRSRRRKV